MTAHASRNGAQRAPKTLDADDGLRPADPSSLDAVVDRRVQAAIQPIEARLESVMDEVVEQLLTDPTAFVKLWPNVLTIQDCGRIYQRHPDTMAGYARLPEDHPDHLPVVDERPYRILPADFAAWITRRRKR